MRILQVTPRYFPNLGGVEVVVERISESFVKRGLSVTVYSMDLSSETLKKQDINGVSVRRFKPLAGDPLYLPPPSFIKAIKREEADIVHVHNAHTLIPTVVALSKTRRQKLLLQPHYHKFGQTRIRNLILSSYKYSLDKLVFPRVEYVIANSPYERRIIHEDFPSCKNVILIQEGISLTEIKSVKWKPGLGLVSMQERAHLLGGDLRIEQPKQGGTRVTVEVPVSGPAASTADDATSSSGESAPRPARSAKDGIADTEPESRST